MTKKKQTHRPIAVLSIPRRVQAFVPYAQSIVTAMTGNPSFPSPVPALALVTTATGALQDAESATLARTKGAVEARDDKRAALVALLQQLRGYVQTVADGDIETAATVIRSAGMAVKKVATAKARTFSAEQGAVSGSAKLVAPSAGPRASYEWQYSTDGGKTWIAAPSTLQARTTVPGLTPGATVEFRFRPILKTGQGDWSQTAQLIVR